MLLFFIDNEGITDPRINLAIEEYALKNLPMDTSYLLFFISTNRRSSLEKKPEYVGGNQLRVCQKAWTPCSPKVIRRRSGVP